MGIYANPMADDGEDTADALRETIRGNLTGLDIAETVAFERSLNNKLDALMLLASVSDDECDIGRQFKQIVMAACELAVDARAPK